MGAVATVAGTTAPAAEPPAPDPAAPAGADEPVVGDTGRRAGAGLRRWWRPALLVVGIVAATLALRGRLPDPASIWTALRQARPGWLLAAVVLQVVSITAFAEQQRHLLAAFGVRMPAPTTVAVTYARSAMATALPAGSAVSAGYAFRQYRSHGASQAIAAAVMLLSGVASATGLTLLYAGDLLALTSPSVRTLALLAAVAALAALAVAAGRAVAATRAPVTPAHPIARRPDAAPSTLARLRGTLRHTAALAATVPARRWLAVVGLAAFNWLTDLACLLAAVHAVGLTVSTGSVATAYLAAQLIRQIPATPGGIGVIEASLILALTTAGAARAPAAAAVLVYRLLSCWSILPIGFICWTTQKTPTAALDLGELAAAPAVLLPQLEGDEDHGDQDRGDDTPEDDRGRSHVVQVEAARPGGPQAERREALPEQEPEQRTEAGGDAVRREVAGLGERDRADRGQHQVDDDRRTLVGLGREAVGDEVAHADQGVAQLPPEHREQHDGGDHDHRDHQAAEDLRTATLTCGHGGPASHR